ncbi:MAG: ornithine cyclodeaminase family protein [Acidimicrobiia bacterium]
MLILDANDLRVLLEPAAIRDALADGYAALTEGRTHVPTRVMAATGRGLLGAMPGYVEGVGLAAKLVTVFGTNAEAGLPSHHALVTLFDDQTGVPLALLDGEVITEMRTSGSAALACDRLAPADVSILTVLGAGVQAAGHLEAFRGLRPWTEIRLANRTPDNARRLAARHEGVTVFDDIATAVEGADVVACTTDAADPLFDASAFSGTHLSTVGLHLEIPPQLLDGATVVVQMQSAVTTPPPNGPVAVQGLSDVVELGEIVNGSHPGRRSGGERTAWVSVGNGMEDVVTARLAYDRAMAAGMGRHLEM